MPCQGAPVGLSGAGEAVGSGEVVTQVTTGVAPQVSLSPDPGVYCARIADAGNLTGPVDFSINIVHPR